MDHNKHTRAPNANEPSMDISEHLKRVRFLSYKGSRSDSKATAKPTSKHNTTELPQFSGYPKESTRPTSSRSSSRLPQIDGNSRSRLPSRSLSAGVSLSQLDARSFSSGVVLSQIDSRSRPRTSEVRSSRGNPISSTQQWDPYTRLPPADASHGTSMPGVDGTNPRSAHDVEMATKQMRIETMNPQERQEQDKWAQAQIAFFGLCPMNFVWHRIEGGYRCAGALGTGGVHYVTDALLAEGKGGLMITSGIRLSAEEKQHMKRLHRQLLARGRKSEAKLTQDAEELVGALDWQDRPIGSPHRVAGPGRDFYECRGPEPPARVPFVRYHEVGDPRAAWGKLARQSEDKKKINAQQFGRESPVGKRRG